MAIRESNGFFYPFLDNHYYDPAIIKAYGRPFLDFHRSSMKNCIPDFYVSGYDFYIGVLRDKLNNALRGSMLAKAALDLAELEWQQITFRSGSSELSEQWAGLLAKSPDAIRQLGR